MERRTEPYYMDHEHTFEAGVCTQCGANEADVNKVPAEGDAPVAETPAEEKPAEETPAA